MKIDKIVIVDGYSDLPFDLGRPPFLAPEVRYIAGACWDRNSKARAIYMTLDDLKSGNKASLIQDAGLVLVYAGVPEARPSVDLTEASGDVPPEVGDLFDFVAYLECPKILGGPYVLVHEPEAREMDFDLVVDGDLSKFTHEVLSEGSTIDGVDPGIRRTNQDLERFSILGAGLAIQNAGYPSFLSLGVELYRGCPSAAQGGCSFCHQNFFTTVEYRPVEDVVAEISKIAELGCENVFFQAPCFYSYFSDPREDGTLDLDHSAIERLLEGAGSVAPELKGLHILNINPAAVANDKDEAEKITKTVVEHCSDGNFPNLRAITFDEEVQLVNNVACSTQDFNEVVDMMSSAGRVTGPNGLPTLLPAVELVYGLAGESQETIEINEERIRELASQKLIRGAVARRLVPIPGTTIAKRDDLEELEDLDQHLEVLRNDINAPLKSGLASPGQLLKDIYAMRSLDTAVQATKVGINSPSLLVHGAAKVGQLQDVRVTEPNNGRLEALSHPLTPKTVSRDLLRMIPGMSEEDINAFMQMRPENEAEFQEIFEDPSIGRRAASYFEFE